MPEKWFLVIWILANNGNAGMGGQEFATKEECQSAEHSLRMEMAKGHAHGRWNLVVKNYKVEGCMRWDEERGFVKEEEI